MGQDSKKYRNCELQIDEVSTTSEKLSGRAGLALFVAYLHSIEIFAMIDRFFGTIRKNKKGLTVFELFKQVLCFMVDGSSRHLTYFDHLFCRKKKTAQFGIYLNHRGVKIELSQGVIFRLTF